MVLRLLNYSRCWMKYTGSGAGVVLRISRWRSLGGEVTAAGGEMADAVM
jgi:hypothetical protein